MKFSIILLVILVGAINLNILPQIYRSEQFLRTTIEDGTYTLFYDLKYSICTDVAIETCLIIYNNYDC